MATSIPRRSSSAAAKRPNRSAAGTMVSTRITNVRPVAATSVYLNLANLWKSRSVPAIAVTGPRRTTKPASEATVRV
ncbi:hypothetical protein ARZXY2_2851 [Arthrobacter sp. ZXY-2]|nr:hypothetical protein ARZXY2_2851 [Arthrobacter sp. ZXY-2]